MTTPKPRGPSPHRPELSAIAVHWGDSALVDELSRAWPDDPRFELLVVANSPLPHPLPGPGRVLAPDGNLGFGGGANAGVAATSGPVILILNPDAVPETGALEALLEGFQRHPDAAGLAPRLVGPEGEPQWPWQLRSLPRARDLLGHAFFLPSPALAEEPAPGATVEQPAAAALAFRREAFEAVGGFDVSFYPAWFEDVDLAKRLAGNGQLLRYYPEAVFRHLLGSSVESLTFGPFLWLYSRNLCHYLARHHGRPAAILAHLLLAVGAWLRLLALPLRRPRRARSRAQAAAGLLAVSWGALSGFRYPRRYRERFRPESKAAGGARP